MEVKTITQGRDGCKVSGAYKLIFPIRKDYYHIRNDGTETAYASVFSDSIDTAEDGVYTIHAGGTLSIKNCGRSYDSGVVYVSGDVTVMGTGSAIPPFKAAVRGGDTDITAVGNPVQINGLQGGVPFSEIIVSCKNLTGNTIISTTGEPVIVTNTDNWSIEWTTGFGIRLSDVKVEMNKDYTVKYSQKSENGTDSMRIMIINSDTGNTVSEQNTANVLTGDEYTDNIFTFNSGTAEHIYIRFVRSTSTGKATLSKMIQLEVGDTATEYEPPITGRELTVNVNGTEHTITPDSNPYVIPNDIRQQDGHNVITVSDGTLSVTGCKSNMAVKRIWDKLDELATAIIVSNGETE